MKAATNLIEKVGGEVEKIVFAISLDEDVLIEMPERKKLLEYNVESILKYN
jgi:adenine/guanine phosphoribosyltransferase-like PRPP-binding protein